MDVVESLAAGLLSLGAPSLSVVVAVVLVGGPGRGCRPGVGGGGVDLRCESTRH